MSQSANFIPCVQWIRRGVAKSKPEMVHITKDDQRFFFKKVRRNQEGMDSSEISKPGKGEGKSDLETGNDQSNPGKNEDEFGLKDYDEDEPSFMDMENIVRLDDSEDQYSDMHDGDDEEEEDSEKEDDEIKPTDNLIAVAHVYENASYLEVYVYNEDASDLYVHHDTMLHSIPLCMDSLSYDSASGNFLAVGSISPEIYIWNLDVVNNIEPHATLGAFSEKKMYQHRNYGHTDAVLDLCWNSKLPHILASGSVDRTVLLWDLDNKRPITKFNKFQDKVQTLQWHPSETNIVLAGSCDGNVRLLDCRVLLDDVFNGLKVPGEVEKVSWDQYNQFNAIIGTSKGELYYTDLRTKKFLWHIQAHSKEITGIGIHQDDHDMLVTCSIDKSIKTWDLTSKEPVLLSTRYTKQGVQCLQMCPENSNIFCVGGEGKENSFSVQLVKEMSEVQVIEARKSTKNEM